VERGIDLPFRDLGSRRGCVVSTTPQPLYPREIPGTHCTGGWVGPRVGLDVCERSLVVHLIINTFLFVIFVSGV
jgi:hypothetical protein